MKLLADQCCHSAIVGGLRADGHDVLYVKESAPGADDETILRSAADQKRILLTEDKDFGEMVVRLGLAAYGIILSRMHTADVDSKLTRLREVLSSQAHQLPGSLAVITPDKVRFRPLRPSTSSGP